MRVTPTEPLGASIEGVALGALAAAEVDELRRLLAGFGVLAFPDQDLDDEGFLAFLRSFGPLAFTKGEAGLPGAPELNEVSNVGREVAPKSNWHVDTSYVREPPAYTALRAVTIPSAGGETLFSNQYRAYETLPEEERRRLRGHSIRHVVTGVELDEGDEREADHPIFRPHPLGGRTALYLTSAARCAAIDGMDADETAEAVEFLLAHSTREDNVHRHAWAPGDVVIWDNGCVLHRADHSGVVGDRVMHRGMVANYG
jgi:taurine dioxygenase